MKRAPAATWNPLTRLLRSLEVGESGVLRVPIEPPARSPDHVFCQLDKTTWGWSYVDEWGGSDYGHHPPPLRPGRYWVPEEWWCCHIVDGLWTFEYRSEAEAPPWPNQQVVMPIHWSPQHRHGWFSPWHLPARAARLACEVGEAEVRPWCEECEGDTVLFGGERAEHGGCLECAEDCPACLGSPGPWWVYEVKRIEVRDAP